MGRISEIHIYRLDLPVVGPSYRMALSTLTSLDTTLVRIVTEDGNQGFGEVCPLGDTYQPAHPAGARAAIATMAPHLIGMDAAEIGLAYQRMDDALLGHAYAKGAIDIALWDLMGKQVGLPLSTLLGGAVVKDVPSYYAISIDSPDEVARHVAEKQKAGYKRLQIKIGGRGIDQDIAVARKAFEMRDPTTAIVLDANRSLTTRDTILLSNALSDLDLSIEQPCDSYEEIKSLRGRLCHPLLLDECITGPDVMMRAICDEVANGFCMKITRVGGVSVMRVIRDIAHAMRRPMTCEDSWGGDIVAAAYTHLAATMRPEMLEAVWIANNYIDGNYDSENPVECIDGRIKVPTGPGLGINPDMTDWELVQSFG